MAGRTGRILILALLIAAVSRSSPVGPAGSGEFAGARRADANPPEITQTEAIRHLLASKRSLGLQTDLPSDGSATPARSPRVLNLSLPTQAARIILVIATISIIAAVASSLGDNLWSFSRSRRIETDARGRDEPLVAAARMEVAQLQADELAQSGNFAEAMHVLLLQSLAELRRKLDVSFASSMTSREILGHVAISREGRSVFADIVRRVEISYFGTHHPGESDYAACRQSYESLAELLRRGRAA
jgi:hypothetical protein